MQLSIEDIKINTETNIVVFGKKNEIQIPLKVLKLIVNNLNQKQSFQNVIVESTSVTITNNDFNFIVDLSILNQILKSHNSNTSNVSTPGVFANTNQDRLADIYLEEQKEILRAAKESTTKQQSYQVYEFDKQTNKVRRKYPNDGLANNESSITNDSNIIRRETLNINTTAEIPLPDEIVSSAEHAIEEYKLNKTSPSAEG